MVESLTVLIQNELAKNNIAPYEISTNNNGVVMGIPKKYGSDELIHYPVSNINFAQVLIQALLGTRGQSRR